MRRLRSRHIRDEWFMVRDEVWGRTARAVASQGPGAEIRQPGAPEVSGDSLYQGDAL